MNTRSSAETMDLDKKQAQASGKGAVAGWVRAGRGGWKPAIKVRLALPCHLQSVVCSIHLLACRR